MRQGVRQRPQLVTKNGSFLRRQMPRFALPEHSELALIEGGRGEVGQYRVESARLRISEDDFEGDETVSNDGAEDVRFSREVAIRGRGSDVDRVRYVTHRDVAVAAAVE